MMSTRVLVVDDEVEVACVVRDVLELEDYEVEVCHDIASARDKIASTHFDAAIIDVYLTEEPLGLTLAKEIHSVSPETSLVFITGYAEENFIREGYGSGIFACIRKPFNLNDVLRVVSIALDGHSNAA